MDDLIKHVIDQKPLEFSQAFDGMAISKLHSAINDKKFEIAQRMFNPSYDEDLDSYSEE